MWIAATLIPLGIIIGGIGYQKFVKNRALIQRRRDAYVPARQMLALLKAEKESSMKVAR